LALLTPLFLIVILELCLRLANYGYPTTFFIRQRIGDQEFYVPNERFGYRFFPPTIARTPFALRIPVKKPANTYRIFIFGESAAQGDPDPTFGVGRYLQTLLRQRYPGHNFEVVCVAMTAINSHAILPIARECTALDCDLWIVYMGNNEMVGPYGAATIFGPKAPPLPLVRASVALKGTKVGQLIARVLGSFRKDSTPQKTWGGLNMFKENPLRHNDPARLRANKNFAGNLESILRAGHATHIPILLSTVACNLSDCPPFASLHRPNLDAQQQAAWDQQFNAAVESQQAGALATARAGFAKASEIDPEYAELQYRMGQCDLGLATVAAPAEGQLLSNSVQGHALPPHPGPLPQGEGGSNPAQSQTQNANHSPAFEKAPPLPEGEGRGEGEQGARNEMIAKVQALHAAAKHEFELARDYDTLAFRADAPINAIISRAGQRHEHDGVSLVNAAEALATKTAEANTPIESKPTAFQQSPTPSPPLEEERSGERRPSISPTNPIAMEGITGEDLFYEHVHLTFEGNYRLAKLFAAQVAAQLPSSITNHAIAAWASLEACDYALAVSPWDRHRVWQANFSRVSEPPFTSQINDAARAKRYMHRLEEFRTQMTPEAQAQTRKMYEEALRSSPDDLHLHGNFAQVLGEFGDFAAAVKEQRRVCELLPQSAPAFHKAGLLLVRQNEIESAATEFRKSLALRPEYVPALDELGTILANQQKTGEATNLFYKALVLNPGYVETYINLGFTEQSAGNIHDALAQYARAAELQPEGPAAYFSRAVTLANQGQSPDAVKLFQAAVWMNPSFWQAHYLLAVEFTRLAQPQEAETQFTEVIRLRPDLAKAHLNLGVALAKRGKLDEALARFETALKLNPTNDLAKQNIEKIRAVKVRKQ
jgi:tetratricopeptide (TPR) repeat protein